MKWPLSLIGAIFLILGCTNNPPMVEQVWWLPVLSLDREGSHVSRELMLYVHAQDEEGPADLAELRLENPAKEILWKIDRNTWSEWETQGEKWIGSSRITGLDDFLSREEYRLVLEDRGGRTGEITLFLEGWPSEKLAFEQKITDQGAGAWMIESDFTNWMIVNAREELVDCPVNTPFNLKDLAGEGSCFFILYNRESMWQIRRGPYF